jgi:hypothetical protein
MRTWAVAAAAAFIPLIVACVVEGGSQQKPQPSPAQPLTVVVDTGQTMNVQGGQGVGVFVEYAPGGHWHVFWSCDTALSGLPCDFQITMSGQSLSNVTQSSFATTDAVQSSSSSTLAVTAHTTTGTPGINFDAAPGTDVTVDMTVSGLRDGRFFFFVQNGQVDGNFQGMLTDPLIFEPSAP